MAAIRSSGNRNTEVLFAKLLRGHRICGWRRGQALTGRPDFVFTKERTAIFIDGCFWHGCKLHCRMPKSREAYWNLKIARNRKRDVEVTHILKRQGWKVVRIWEHSLKPPYPCLRRLQAILASRRLAG
jgi:DNA mismatch endonuclease (patch repair protein)